MGFRDASANPPWIEFATSPSTRFVFEPREMPRTFQGGRFVARKHPPGYLELLEAVGELGFALGDLSCSLSRVESRVARQGKGNSPRLAFGYRVGTLMCRSNAGVLVDPH
ncbi:hypothetical protein GCM10009107_30100 [Ideonella azotifigens]|uniref:Uncharacterized protein n=1 Tax=Ideonella azotifigens TaxID=513160 RepID=A0ABP3VD67_9BURK